MQFKLDLSSCSDMRGCNSVVKTVKSSDEQQNSHLIPWTVDSVPAVNTHCPVSRLGDSRTCVRAVMRGGGRI